MFEATYKIVVTAIWGIFWAFLSIHRYNTGTTFPLLESLHFRARTLLGCTLLAALVVILGDLSIQGNIKTLRSLVESLQVAMDNGASTALIPLENKRNFLETSWSELTPVFTGPSRASEHW